MNHMTAGFLDELIKMGQVDSKAVPRMPPVAGGRPEYKASGSFKPDLPKIEHPGSLKMAKDLIPGGMAAGKKDEDFDPEQIRKGEKVELEHTPSKARAREIARDHLEEFPNYYTELDKMEEKLKEQKVATVLTLMKAADGAGGDEEAGKEEEEEHSPSKPPPPEIRAKIEEYLRTHNVKHDRDFHEFVESLGVSPHDAEPIAYQMAHAAAKEED
jgi:hypothetical protein